MTSLLVLGELTTDDELEELREFLPDFQIVRCFEEVEGLFEVILHSLSGYDCLAYINMLGEHLDFPGRMTQVTRR